MKQIASVARDTITRLAFASTAEPDGLLLAASSWDGRLCVYDAKTGALRADFCATGPLLDCAFCDGKRLVTAGYDKAVYLFCTDSGQAEVIGRHEDVIKCIVFCPATAVVASASYDRQLCLWSLGSKQLLAKTMLPESPHFAAVSPGGDLLVAGDNRSVSAHSPADGSMRWQRESPLKHASRCIASGTANSFCIASTEGRVAVDFFGSSGEPKAAERFAFKCHRQQIEGVEHVYPVNALALHPLRPTLLATGGSDGHVTIWDTASKRRIKAFPRFASTISALAFSPDGSSLAVADSYVYDQGELASTQLGSHQVYLLDTSQL